MAGLIRANGFSNVTLLVTELQKARKSLPAYGLVQGPDWNSERDYSYYDGDKKGIDGLIQALQKIDFSKFPKKKPSGGFIFFEVMGPIAVAAGVAAWALPKIFPATASISWSSVPWWGIGGAAAAALAAALAALGARHKETLRSRLAPGTLTLTAA